MKKLLTVLGALTLTTSALSSVVACTNTSSDSDGDKKTAAENSGLEMKLTKDFNTSYKTQPDVQQQEIDGRPLGKYWMPEGLENKNTSWFPNMKDLQTGAFNFYDYDISKDKDAKYNRSSVKLKKKINTLGSNQYQDKTGKVKNIVMGVMNRTTSGVAAQGNSVFNNYNFTNWQYVDIYAAWAGSNGEGIIVLPTPDIVDAAHMNGTQVLGMIYFDGFWGLQENPDLIKTFFAKDEKGNYKVVDKLIEVANYFGFDGWFWNDEANASREGEPAIIAPDDDVIGVMKQYHDKIQAKKLDLLMVSYSNGTYLTEGEKQDLAEKFVRNSDYFIEDYKPRGEATGKWFDERPELKDKQFNVSSMPNLAWWNDDDDDVPDKDKKNNSQKFAKYDLSEYIGKKEENGTVTPMNSFSTFALADTLKWGENDAKYGKPSNINHYFRQHDNTVFSGLEMDPSKVGIDDNHGLANYLLEKSTYNEPEFLTNFSTGQGVDFFINGQKVKTNADWNMRGVIDQVATYQWKVNNEEGNELFADYDYSKAYQKGNSIALKSNRWKDESSKYNGGIMKAGAKTTIDLLGTEIKVEDQKLAMKLAATENDQKDLFADQSLTAKFVLTFDDQTNKEVGTDAVAVKNSDGWYNVEADLAEFKDKTLKDVSLQFVAKEDHDKEHTVSINIGEISLLKNTTKNLTNLENFKVEYVIDKDVITKNLRVYWDETKDDYDRYEFYQEDENGNRIFLGTTRSNAYFIENFKKKNGNKLVVKVVSRLDSNLNFESSYEF